MQRTGHFLTVQRLTSDLTSQAMVKRHCLAVIQATVRQTPNVLFQVPRWTDEMLPLCSIYSEYFASLLYAPVQSDHSRTAP